MSTDPLDPAEEIVSIASAALTEAAAMAATCAPCPTAISNAASLMCLVDRDPESSFATSGFPKLELEEAPRLGTYYFTPS
jgi:hypothetical protein